MNIEKILKDKRKDIINIATHYGARKIRIFGSILQGKINQHNDIDFIVDLESGRSLLDIVAIKQDLEDLLGCNVDVVTEAALSPYMRDAVLSQAVSL